ncbi:MAG: hypothetical protein ABSA52_20320 [Candidatus Binatia bacterium]
MAAGKRKAARLDAYLVFLDESGFLIIPNLAKTWAPRGSKPEPEAITMSAGTSSRSASACSWRHTITLSWAVAALPTRPFDGAQDRRIEGRRLRVVVHSLLSPTVTLRSRISALWVGRAV